MRLCEYCESKFADERYMFCPYCGSELVEAVEVSWGGVRDEIAENSVRIEPQRCEDCNWDGPIDSLEVVFK